MIIGILLAGGKSSRFLHGDKALYKNWAVLAFEKLSALTGKLFLSASLTNATELAQRFPSASILTDSSDFAGQGPLSGLYAVSKVLPEKTEYLILTVDTPEIPVSALQDLLAADNTYAANQYTLAHITFSYQQLTAFLKTGSRRMQDFLNFLEAQPLQLPANLLISHNEN